LYFVAVARQQGGVLAHDAFRPADDRGKAGVQQQDFHQRRASMPGRAPAANRGRAGRWR
jgi:hypothetical protein